MHKILPPAFYKACLAESVSGDSLNCRVVLKTAKVSGVAKWMITVLLYSFMSIFNCAWAELRIAVVGPMTGQAIFRGEQVQRGAQMAVSDINNSGGVLGQKVRLTISDDACDPDQATVVAKHLVASNVSFVAGHVCSDCSIAASDTYEKAGVLMISPASTNPQLTDSGKTMIFRICGRDDDQGKKAAAFMLERWKDKNIAIIHDGTMYGKGLADVTRDSLLQGGVSPVLYREIDPGQVLYDEAVAELKKTGADVLYFGGYPAEAALIVREIENQGFRVQLIGGDSLTTKEFWLIGGPGGEGTFMTFSPDPRKQEEAADTVLAFRAEGFEPLGYTLHTYAAVQVWAQAAELAGTTDAIKVAQVLLENKFETVLGQVSFDHKGDNTGSDFKWYIWKEGDYSEID